MEDVRMSNKMKLYGVTGSNYRLVNFLYMNWLEIPKVGR